MKYIEDYPNYSVTTEGSVINTKTGRVLKTDMNSCGYLRVTLCKENTPRKFFIHRLVAKTYLDNEGDFPQVNHIDGNKTNNTIENLEWCTQSINQYHAHANNLQKRFTKVSETQVHKICELIGEGLTVRSISETLEISRYIPEDIKRGKTWRHISKNYF